MNQPHRLRQQFPVTADEVTAGRGHPGQETGADAQRHAEAERAALLAQQEAAQVTELARLAELARRAEAAAHAVREAVETERQREEEVAAAEAALREAEERLAQSQAEEEVLRETQLRAAQEKREDAEQRAQIDREAEEARRVEIEAEQKARTEREAEEDRQAGLEQDGQRIAETMRVEDDARQTELEQAERARQAAEADHVAREAEEARLAREAAEQELADREAELLVAEAAREKATAEAAALQAEALGVEIERLTAEADAREAEKDRALALERANQAVELAREAAADDLARRRGLGLEGLLDSTELDDAVGRLRADAADAGLGVDWLERQRDELLATHRDRFGDNNLSVQAALSDYLEPGRASLLVAREDADTAEQAGRARVSVEMGNWADLGGRLVDVPVDVVPGYGLLDPSAAVPATGEGDLSRGMEQLATDEAIERMTQRRELAEQMGEAVGDLMRDLTQTRSAHLVREIEPVLVLDLPGHGQAQAQEELHAGVGIGSESPSVLGQEALPGESLMVGGPILAMLAIRNTVEVWRDRRAWLEEHFADRVAPSAPELSIGGDAHLSLPLDAGGEARVVDWVPPALDGPPASAADRHAAYFADAPALGTMSMEGRPAEELRAEMGLAEWAAFKEEQAALQVDIAKALEAGDAERASMLTLKLHMQGTDFAAQTAEEVHAIARTVHGEGSTQEIEARLRADNWAEQHELLEGYWGANAVRSDLYVPTTPAMAEQVSECRAHEREADEAFERETRGEGGRERREAQQEHQEKKDRELCEAFAIPALNHGYEVGFGGLGMGTAGP
jgi:hypothetical protein